MVFLLDYKCVIHISHPYPGGRGSTKGFLFKMYKFATMGLTGDPIAAPLPVHRIYF